MFASMYTSPYVCPDMHWQVTKKDTEKKKKGLAEALACVMGQELRNEPERPQGLSIPFHANLLSLDFSTII